MSATKINGATQIQSATITAAQLSASAGITDGQLSNGANFLKKDGSVALTADQPCGGFKLVNIGSPVSSTDGATKGYVDAAINGLDWKASVRAATTVNGTLATAYANGQVIDGVTLATGNRILLKNQTSGSENGIYTVNVNGAPTRATDSDANAEVTAGLSVFISEGSTNGNTQWTLTTDDPITLDTTALVFSQIGAGTTYTGSNGVQVNGSVISPSYGSSANTVCQGNDSRLSDARTPVGTALLTTKIWVGSGGNVAAAVSVSGDVTLANDGVMTVSVNTSTGFLKYSNKVTRETPSGTINGSNVTFALASTPVSGSEEVFLNGILQDAGAGNDYTISTGTITMLTAPLSGDKIRVNYMK